MKHYASIPYTQVDIDGGFWQKRQQLNRDVTTDSVMRRFQETGRFDAFRQDWREGRPLKPHIFWDSDIAKWMEGVAYLLKKAPAPEYEAVMEETISLIEAGRDRFGYFNSYFQAVEPSKRYTQRWAHELYCAGHLMEAAVAYDEATGRDRFLKLMMDYADYIDRVFRIEGSAEFETPGHQEIELALIKLYRHTGKRNYLELARFFVDRRGNNAKDNPADTPLHELYANQSHAPVRDMTSAVGHAVRAGYLYSAMADVAFETQDEALFAACRTLFSDIVEKKLYITGGVGSSRYTEAYTVDYDLPNATAYTETCASIALAYFARRMLTLEPDSRYADVIETILYNGFLSSTSLDGKSFFYSNPLYVSLRDRSRNVSAKAGEWLPRNLREEVFGCSCCPPNITRFVASVGEYLYTAGEDCLFVHQYMNSSSRMTVGSKTIRVRQETDYPTNGLVRITVEGGAGLKLAVRIPGWCSSHSLDHDARMENGYAVVPCDADAFTLTLSLQMEPQLIEANPEVQACAGRVALRKGPVVYCLEAIDNGERLQDVRIGADFAPQDGWLDSLGVPVIHATGWRRKAEKTKWLYRPVSGALEQTRLTFIPYYAFSNRGETDMQVWTLAK